MPIEWEATRFDFSGEACKGYFPVAWVVGACLAGEDDVALFEFLLLAEDLDLFSVMLFKTYCLSA